MQHKHKKWFGLVLVWGLSCLVAQAQTVPGAEQPSTTNEIATATSAPALLPGTVDCFDYYQFGSVQVDIQSRLSQTVPGVPMTFSGSVVNQNNYPVVDGAVYVKIFRKNADVNIQSNGYDLVDQFVAADNIALAAKGTKPIQFDWKVPANAIGGEYQIATFFIVGKKFNLLGLSFTDDVVGNRFDFSVVNQSKSSVSFDKNSVTTNGKQFLFAAFPPRFKAEEVVTVKADLVNLTKQTQDIPVTWTLYAWDGQAKENVIEKKTEIVKIVANSKKNLAYEIKPQQHPVSYLVVEAKNQDAKSILDVRVVRQGIEKLRLNYPALTAYPLKANQNASMFSCLHNSGQAVAVPGGKLELILKDEQGNVIDQNIYEGPVTGAMMAVKKDFTPQKDYTNFTLSAKLYQDGKLVDSSDMKYDCQTLNPGLCVTENIVTPTVKGPTENNRKYIWVGLLVVGLIGLLGLIAVLLRKKKELPVVTLLGLIVAGGMMLGGSTEKVSAYSTSWSLKKPEHVVAAGGLLTCSKKTGCGAGYDAVGNLIVSVNYVSDAVSAAGVNVSNKDAVTVGEPFELRVKKFANMDITWFGTGYGADSPYGYWVDGAKMPTGVKCEASDSGGIYEDADIRELFFPFAVKPPVVTVDGLANAVCTEKSLSAAEVATLQTKFECVASSPGPVTAAVKFEVTYGKFYQQNRLVTLAGKPLGPCDNEGFYTSYNAEIEASTKTQINIPAQAINFNFNAVSAANGTPNPPVITGPATGTISTAMGYNFVATDPDGDQVAYQIDWTKSGVPSQIVPGVGFVASGTSQSAANPTAIAPWNLAGNATFQARTMDSKGAVSAWAEYTVVLTPPCVPTYSGQTCYELNVAPNCSLPANFGTTYTINRQCKATNSCTGLLEDVAASSCTGGCEDLNLTCPTGPGGSTSIGGYKEVGL